MTLKSLYSKFVMSICENKYSQADTILDEILTEKVKRKVAKAATEKCDKKSCCGGRCKKD